MIETRHSSTRSTCAEPIRDLFRSWERGICRVTWLSARDTVAPTADRPARNYRHRPEQYEIYGTDTNLHWRSYIGALLGFGVSLKVMCLSESETYAAPYIQLKHATSKNQALRWRRLKF